MSASDLNLGAHGTFSSVTLNQGALNAPRAPVEKQTVYSWSSTLTGISMEVDIHRIVEESDGKWSSKGGNLFTI